MTYSYLNDIFSLKSFSSFIIEENITSHSLSAFNDNKTYDVFENYESYYDTLSLKYRNEYFFKSKLFNQLIVKKNKLAKKSVFTELNIGKSIADFVVVDNNINIFEIKTEYDNLYRLDAQINNYYKVSPVVSVVVSEKHLAKVLNRYQNGNLGIMVMTKRGLIKTIRRPKMVYENLDSQALFGILRKTEYENVISSIYSQLPQCDSFSYYSECKKIFKNTDPYEIYKLVVSILEERVSCDPNTILKYPEAVRLFMYDSKNIKSFGNDNKKERGLKKHVFSNFAWATK